MKWHNVYLFCMCFSSTDLELHAAQEFKWGFDTLFCISNLRAGWKLIGVEPCKCDEALQSTSTRRRLFQSMTLL